MFSPGNPSYLRLATRLLLDLLSVVSLPVLVAQGCCADPEMQTVVAIASWYQKGGLAKYYDEDQIAIEKKASNEGSVEQHQDYSGEMQRQGRGHLVKQLVPKLALHL